ncbi:MAG: ATP-grasp domain-containing protein [Acidobacteriaceae bacterium]
MAEAPRILCISTYEKGQALLRECAALGCRVTLLTVEKLREADWPREILDELLTMPEGLTLDQVTNTVTYLARTRRFERVIALDEFDMETAAHLREHMQIPGMGRTTTAHFRDKLAMRFAAQRAGALVPEFMRVLNYEELRQWMERVPPPWVLKPRAEASAIGIRKMEGAEQLWAALEELGDRQTSFLLEQFVPGDIFHVDSIVSEGAVVFAAVSGYGKPPMQVMHEGGVFTTRVLERGSAETGGLTAINNRLMPAMGMLRGVTHAEYIRGRDGRFYFLEAGARVGGAFIADVVEAATGVNLWREWARIEVGNLLGQRYQVPAQRALYAGSALCLARTAEPDTSIFTDPEIVLRVKKHHHAGLIVQSENAERVRVLVEHYAERFAQEYLAVAPVPEKPTA